jgi:hypothetical protein
MQIIPQCVDRQFHPVTWRLEIEKKKETDQIEEEKKREEEEYERRKREMENELAEPGVRKTGIEQ